MEITITREDFEHSLPAGQSAHESVFEAIEPAIEETIEIVAEDILGTVGETMVQNMKPLRRWFIKYVCITAFLSVLRQLDLVLTQSGFGIVSSDKVSPASKQRVDALESSLRTAQLSAYARMISHLRSAEWGVTDQAVQNIPYIYNEECFFYLAVTPGRSYQDWTAMRQSVERADEILRLKISDAQMDAVMAAFRQGDNTYMHLNGMLRKFCEDLNNMGEVDAIRFTLPRIFRMLESNLDKYTDWANSQEYDAFHCETFHNTGDSTAYVFG